MFSRTTFIVLFPVCCLNQSSDPCAAKLRSSISVWNWGLQKGFCYCLRSRDRVFTRTSLALTGFVAVIFGIVAGYGLSMLIGLPFTSLQQVSFSVFCLFSLLFSLSRLLSLMRVALPIGAARSQTAPQPSNWEQQQHVSANAGDAVPHNSGTYCGVLLPQTLPFILEGIGLDVIFILVKVRLRC